MRKTDKPDAAIGVLKQHYYGNIILLAVFFLLIFCSVIPPFTNSRFVSVSIERYAIMVTIIAIPVSLKLFAFRLKKTPRTLGTAAAIGKYRNIFLLRLYSISVVTLMHIFLFGISRNTNFFWFTVVLFIVFLFCKPSYEELQSLSEEPAKESLPNQ